MTTNDYLETLPVLSFTDNWNKKLHAKVFTTIRRMNRVRYQKRERFHVIYKDKIRFVAQIVDVRHCKAGELTLWEMALDTGYGRKATLEVLARMYHCTPQQAKQLNISYVLLQRIPQDQLEKELNTTTPTQ